MAAVDETRVVRGRVVHVSTCETCGGTGQVVSCAHGRNCDCAGFHITCWDCDGRKEVEDPDCDCVTCMAALTNAEASIP